MKKLTFIFLMTLLFCTNGFGQNIFKAVADGNLDEVKKMVAKDKSLVNATDGAKKTPVHDAATGGHVEILAFFLKTEFMYMSEGRL